MGENELFGLAGIAATAALKSRMLKGAQRGPDPKPTTNIYKLDGAPLAKDFRVRLKIPGSVLPPILARNAQGNEPLSFIFPYTPSITFDHKANYSAQTAIHSNFTQYFYQNSSVSPITIAGKFTVENDADAYYLADFIPILRSLTKMRVGKDSSAGSPPPVCRLSGYGPDVLENVPVVITSFKYELPENVDYYSIKTPSSSVTSGSGRQNSFPVISTITLTCNPVYSRREMMDYSNEAWLSGSLSSQTNTGYL